MLFTWKDIILITIKMFECKQKDIAKYLNVTASTLSRYKKGEIKPPTLYYNEFYEKIFNLKNEKSMINEVKNKYPLSSLEKGIKESLKEIIENKKLKEVMKDVWEKEYETFVTTMLIRTTSDSTSENEKTIKNENNNKTDSINNTSTDNIHKLDDKQPANDETSFEQMLLDIFQQAIIDCNISVFMNTDPSVPCGTFFKTDYWIDGFGFVDIIKKKILTPFLNKQKKTLYIQIREFIRKLYVYCNYLTDNMVIMKELGNCDYAQPNQNIEGGLQKFSEETYNYRKEIYDLYGEICDGDRLFEEFYW